MKMNAASWFKTLPPDTKSSYERLEQSSNDVELKNRVHFSKLKAYFASPETEHSIQIPNTNQSASQTHAEPVASTSKAPAVVTSNTVVENQSKIPNPILSSRSSDHIRNRGYTVKLQMAKRRLKLTNLFDTAFKRNPIKGHSAIRCDKDPILRLPVGAVQTLNCFTVISPGSARWRFEVRTLR